MNYYDEQALRYWRQYLPGSYGRLENPVRFFTDLGEQADAEIEDRYLEYAGADAPGESGKEQASAAAPGDEPGGRGSVRGAGDPEPGQPGRAGPGAGDPPAS